FWDRPHRARKEMAFNVFELMHGVKRSAESGGVYRMQSRFDIPAPLPASYMGDGGWTRKEESALM
ncbi:MAG: gfo/Idh/MocA family oxidoreductase, partial [Oscillospiraceae bacterium]|nr:gfo/Idh/MocA family oxidoreductase [Oscillospiraceae bacterium]